jgi:mRNA-degrading endonuclease RelE of RelBE toxin-antitoxin system
MEVFDRKYAKLDAEAQKAIDKALRLFLREPKPKSLRIKKMEGFKGIFEMSATMGIRITFSYEKPDTVIIRNCGHHDETLKNP